MIENAQGVVARHPEFAFGHDVLAAAYAEAAESIDVPDRAKAMKEAARREANLTLKLDPEDAGAYAVLSGLDADLRLPRARSDFAARHKIREASEAAAWRIILVRRHIARQRRASARGAFLPIGRARYRRMGCPKNGQARAHLCQHGEPACGESLLQKGFSSGRTIRASGGCDGTLLVFTSSQSDALATFDAHGCADSSDDSKAIWRTFIEARAAHSERSDCGGHPQDSRGCQSGTKSLARMRS